MNAEGFSRKPFSAFYYYTIFYKKVNINFIIYYITILFAIAFLLRAAISIFLGGHIDAKTMS